MKYAFSFKEENYGRVEIEADHMPTTSEIIDAIESGNAYFKDTEYEDIRFEGCEHQPPKRKNDRER